MATIDRRALLAGMAAAGAAAAGIDAASAQTPVLASPEAEAGWSFTDFLGRTTTLPQPPQRIASEIGSAAALYDMGVQVHAVYGGPANDPDGSPEAWGRLPVDSVINVSNADGYPDPEAMVAAGVDLIVFGTTELEDPASYGGANEDSAAMQGVAPYAVWPFLDRVDRTSDAIFELAIALGADPESPENSAAREGWIAAENRLRELLAAKPGLSTFFAYPVTEELDVANPVLWDDVAYFTSLGLTNVIDPAEAGSDWWVVLSWEQVGQYPSDTVFVAQESGAIPIADLKSHPTFSTHPAMIADQVGMWSWYFARSPQGITGLIDNVLAVIETAEVVTGG